MEKVIWSLSIGLIIITLAVSPKILEIIMTNNVEEKMQKLIEKVRERFNLLHPRVSTAQLVARKYKKDLVVIFHLTEQFIGAVHYGKNESWATTGERLKYLVMTEVKKYIGKYDAMQTDEKKLLKTLDRVIADYVVLARVARTDSARMQAIEKQTALLNLKEFLELMLNTKNIPAK